MCQNCFCVRVSFFHSNHQKGPYEITHKPTSGPLVPYEILHNSVSVTTKPFHFFLPAGQNI